MSAFEGTPLTMALRDCGVQRFVIVGVATEIGIDITCRHRADLGFIPILWFAMHAELDTRMQLSAHSRPRVPR